MTSRPDDLRRPVSRSTRRPGVARVVRDERAKLRGRILGGCGL
jgi:hypothetical protein